MRVCRPASKTQLSWLTLGISIGGISPLQPLTMMHTWTFPFCYRLDRNKTACMVDLAMCPLSSLHLHSIRLVPQSKMLSNLNNDRAERHLLSRALSFPSGFPKSGYRSRITSSFNLCQACKVVLDCELPFHRDQLTPDMLRVGALVP